MLKKLKYISFIIFIIYGQIKMYILVGVIIFFCLLGLIVYKTIPYQQFDDKPITFYHPIIRRKYCKIIMILQTSPNRVDLKTLMENLVKENNYLLEHHPYQNMDERLNMIIRSREIQTIFNLLDKKI